MAIVDYLADALGLPGSWPGANADPAYALQLLKVSYEDAMGLEMQNLESKLASMARQTQIQGYEKRIPRWNITTLSQRARGAFVGDDVGGVASDETGIRTVVLRGAPKEHKEFFDMRDDVGLDGLFQALVPGGEYQNNIMGAMNREADAVFATALDAAVQLGDGGGSAAYAGTSADGTMDATGSTAGTAVTGANSYKLVELRSIMDQNDANSMLVGAIHPLQVKQLLNDASNRITNADYNPLQPLLGGEFTKFLGIEWRMSTDVPAVTDIDAVTGGNQAGHKMFVWNPAAMVNGQGKRVAWAREVTERPESMLVYASMFFGAVRTDDKGVTFVNCIDA